MVKLIMLYRNILAHTGIYRMEETINTNFIILNYK